jgi:3-phosphoshikimate 1-carboxyvinyltransferase
MDPFTLPARREGLRGTVTLPTSKSLTNRALIASAVAGGGTIVSPLDCDDTRVLATALVDAGWPVEWETDIEVGERTVPEQQVRLNLEDSGTGSRLILALLAASPGSCIVDGSARLRQRPMRPLLDALIRLGAVVRSRDGFLPVEIEGAVLEGGAVEVRPEVSSQFVSALVLAGPLMRKGLDLGVSGQLPSAPYLDLTVDALRAFGSELDVSGDRRRWHVRPVPLQRTRYEVEGDWSAAAFFLAALAVVGGEVEVGPLDPASRQGDRAVVRILADAGLDVDWSEGRLIARGPVTAPIVADLRHTPDLFPALAAAAACAPPGSRFSGLDHLKHKESDRLTVMVENLERLGATLRVHGSELVVEATIDTVSAAPTAVTAAGDHRIAMAMAVAALAAGPLELDDPGCVTKSFPQFWKLWDRLLGNPERRESVT